MWRSFACPRFTFPVAVFLKRLEAPLWDFSFGIASSEQLSAFSRQLSEFFYSDFHCRLGRVVIPSEARNLLFGGTDVTAYDAGLATWAGGFGAGALCAAAFCFSCFSCFSLSFSRSLSDFFGARIACSVLPSCRGRNSTIQCGSTSFIRRSRIC